MTRTNDFLLLVARLAVASLFLPAGISKLFGLSGFAASLASKGLPIPEVLAFLGAATEVVGSLALIVGVAPKITAALLAAFTIVATLISHRYWDFTEAARQAQQMQFFKNAAIAAGLLFYFVSGPGGLRLANLVARPRSERLAHAS
jgi:putative oxidoreductase